MNASEGTEWALRSHFGFPYEVMKPVRSPKQAEPEEAAADGERPHGFSAVLAHRLASLVKRLSHATTVQPPLAIEHTDQ